MVSLVEQAAPSAPLLLEAWWEKDDTGRASLRAQPAQPFYLRPPHITKAAKA